MQSHFNKNPLLLPCFQNIEFIVVWTDWGDKADLRNETPQRLTGKPEPVRQGEKFAVLFVITELNLIYSNKGQHGIVCQQA